MYIRSKIKHILYFMLYILPYLKSRLKLSCYIYLESQNYTALTHTNALYYMYMYMYLIIIHKKEK